MSILDKAAAALRGVHRDLPEGVKWHMLQDPEQQPCKKCGAVLPVICAASPPGDHDGSYKHKVLLLALGEAEVAGEWASWAPEEWQGRIPKHPRISQADPIKHYGIYGKQHKVEHAPKEPDAEGYSDINELMGAPPPMEEQIKRLQGGS